MKKTLLLTTATLLLLGGATAVLAKPICKVKPLTNWTMVERTSDGSLKQVRHGKVKMWLPSCRVEVTSTDYKNGKFYVTGEVTAPGKHGWVDLNVDFVLNEE